MKRIFISGPMSDLPDMNYPAFHRAAEALRAQGHHVESPAENPPQPDWPSYMALSLAQMLTCDEVYLLPGWEQSSGAVWEASIAHGLGIPLSVITKCGGGWLVTRNLVAEDAAHLIALPAPGALRKKKSTEDEDEVPIEFQYMRQRRVEDAMRICQAFGLVPRAVRRDTP